MTPPPVIDPAAFAVRLIASDLDGTLIGRDLMWPAGLPDALAVVRAAGIETIVTTGRMLQSARRMVARLGFTTGPVICYQGALVADLGSGEWLHHVPMRGEAAAAVVRQVRTMGRQLNACIDDQLFVEAVTAEARRYAEHVEVDIVVVDDLEEMARERPPTKLVLVTSPADVDAILPDLQHRWGERLFVTRSQPDYIEFTDGAVRKSIALAWLCDGLGVERDAVMAFGDGMNDVDMLEWAACGVAVAEAAAEVRAAADVVVPRAELPRLLLDLARSGGPAAR